MRAFLSTAAIAAVLMLTACEKNDGPSEDTFEPIYEPPGTEPAPGRYEEPAQPPAQQPPPVEPQQPPQQ